MADRPIGQESFGFMGRERGDNAEPEEIADAVEWALIERLLGTSMRRRMAILGNDT